MHSYSNTDRLAAGQALRKTIPRKAHASWTSGEHQRDPIEILEHSSKGRLPQLIPVRYGRMLKGPFAFLRGSPALMARDLATTPTTGIQVQACGDCHLLNFGLFATPERNLIFDLNDFDETLRAPWEWDLKRLATSFVLAGRENGMSERRSRQAAIECACSYKRHMRRFCRMSPLEVWYERLSAEDLIDLAACDRSRDAKERMASRARTRSGENLLPKITESVGGQHRFVEQPPLVTRLTEDRWPDAVREGIKEYRESLPAEIRFLLARYRLEDFALRVVGVGSIGTRCYVGLFFCDDRNSLLLQVKEARPSVLEPYAGKCPFENQGQRVVVGQRLMQSASDMFLGWARGKSGHHYYIRQLRDMKFSIPIHDFTAKQLQQHAAICGWTLARAHAKSGDAATISGYVGRGGNFEQAIGDFAVAYADQTERDHAALVKAVRSGQIEALIENGQ